MKKKLLRIWYNILFQFDQHRNKLPDWYMKEKPFHQRPEHLQRIAIAQDVIAQIKSRKYRANRGSYITDLYAPGMDAEADVQNNFDKLQKCEVCALGACFLSAVKFKNTITFDDLRRLDASAGSFHSSKKVSNLLYSLFSPKQLFLIESAFETSHSIEHYTKGDFADWDERENEQNKAHEFGRKFDDSSEDRLIAIMQNIIDNKGEFKP